jgi:hypothetical protein
VRLKLAPLFNSNLQGDRMLASIRSGRALGRSAWGAVLSLVLCAPAIAALGERLDAAIVDTPRALAGASLYTQHLADGVTLRHYVNPAGLVFAVGWQGPVLPDFRRLLGAAFQPYSEALRQQGRHVHIQRNDLVLDAGGMMHAFSGYAYLPALLPPTLSGADLQSAAGK